jgi:gluconate 2-dehydrogenase alpha chain
MKTLPAADVVIVGGGWAGLLLAKELGSRTGLSIVVLERGGPPKTAEYRRGMDELDYAVRLRMMQDVSRETVTLRHTVRCLCGSMALSFQERAWVARESIGTA